MVKTIATIEIAIEQAASPTQIVKGALILEGKNSYSVNLVRPDGSKQTATIEANSEQPATIWLIQNLKAVVDSYDPNIATVKVLSDTLNLLPKITYRCPNPSCQAKLFESWGEATGIRIVCRKCKTLGVPKRAEDG